MALIDYNAIATGIATVIRSDATLGEPGRNVTVVIEPGIVHSIEATPWIGIYLSRRDAPATMQKLRAGSSLDLELGFTLAVVEHSFDGFPEAARLRNDILGRLEVVMLNNHTLDGTVQTSWINGGVFENAEPESDRGCVAMAFLDLVCKVQATT